MILEGIALVALYKLATEKEESTPVNVAEWTRFDHLFQKYGAKYGVDMDWLKAIALNESDLGRHPSVVRGMQNPFDIQGSKSSDGKSWGLMQVTLSTALSLDPAATEWKLNDPEYSIDLAARYIAWLRTLKYLGDNPEWIIKSYNQGPGNTKKEIAGGQGFANDYWQRFQRNLKRVVA